jgi:hypothetical protein
MLKFIGKVDLSRVRVLNSAQIFESILFANHHVTIYNPVPKYRCNVINSDRGIVVHTLGKA